MSDDVNVCTNQVMLFFRHLDDRNYDALVSLLAPDSRWHRQGKILQGPEQALEALKLRSPTMRIAHVITNLVVDTHDARSCAMRGYLLVFRHDDGVVNAGPSRLDGVDSVRTMHIQSKRMGDQWLIAEIKDEGIMFARDA